MFLTAGQTVEASPGGRLGAVSRIARSAVGQWREGRVTFDDTPLSVALAEFERYGTTGLRISDPAVAALRLNGSFDMRKTENFAQALTRVLPVRRKRTGIPP